MLFVDVRGSTSMAERMAPRAFGAEMNRFYADATAVLVDTHAYVDKLVGDEVVAFFVPAFAGNTARAAIDAGRALLAVPDGTRNGGRPVRVGVGIHHGLAYFGTVSAAGGALSDITALGDAVNVAARLASRARPGQALVSAAACAAAGTAVDAVGRRQWLYVKGRADPVEVAVVRQAPATDLLATREEP